MCESVMTYVMICSVQSLAQSCLTLCDPMDCNTPGFLVHYQLPELAQTHVHWVGDAIQPSHPLLSPSSAFILSQNQGIFQWVSSSHQAYMSWYIVRNLEGKNFDLKVGPKKKALSSCRYVNSCPPVCSPPAPSICPVSKAVNWLSTHCVFYTTSSHVANFTSLFFKKVIN